MSAVLVVTVLVGAYLVPSTWSTDALTWRDLLRAWGAVVAVAAVVAVVVERLRSWGWPVEGLVLGSPLLGAAVGAALLIGGGHETSGEATNGLVFMTGLSGIVGLVAALLCVAAGWLFESRARRRRSD